MNKPNDRGYFMRIAFVVNSFPSLSQTFILNQITGLLDLGHKVDIFAHRNPREDKIHQDVIEYNLMERTRYIANVPRSKLKLLLKTLGLTLINFYKGPGAILKSLNVYKYHQDALSLKMFYSVLSFLGSPKYDIVHCHFGPNGTSGILLRELGVTKGKIITTFYGYDISRYVIDKGENVYQKLFRNGDLFIAISDYIKNKLVKLGCPENLAIKHSIGISPPKFTFRERSLKSQEFVRLLTVARLVEKKG